jgi:hypothetical protein
MNATTFFVGLASGAASAVLSIVLASGSMLSLFLFLFAPLPIFIAALGWRHHAGFVGALVGTVLLYALMGFATAQSYALSVGLPAWWMAYLALLGQPVDPENPTPEHGMIWYPVGRLVAWAAVIGSALVLATIVLHGGTVEDYRGTLRTTFETFLRAETGAEPGAPIALPGGGDAVRVIEIAVLTLPPLAAAVWTAVALINLWVAGRIVRASGRLARPWPDLSAFHLPGFTLMALIGGVAGSLLPGLFGFAAGVIGAAFAIVFTVLGLALLHAGTRGTAGRTMMLSVTYFLMAVQTWLVLVVTAIGVVEFLFGIRARISAAKPPPKLPK